MGARQVGRDTPRLGPARLRGGGGEDRGKIHDVRLHEPNLVEDSEPGLHRFVFLQVPPDTGAAIEKLLRPDMPVAQSVFNETMRLLRLRSQLYGHCTASTRCSF
jgi:hypothetical protein